MESRMPPVNEFASVMSQKTRNKINIIILNQLIHIKLKALMILKRLIIKNIIQSKSRKLKIF